MKLSLPKEARIMPQLGMFLGLLVLALVLASGCALDKHTLEAVTALETSEWNGFCFLSHPVGEDPTHGVISGVQTPRSSVALGYDRELRFPWMKLVRYNGEWGLSETGPAWVGGSFFENGEEIIANYHQYVPGGKIPFSEHIVQVTGKVNRNRTSNSSLLIQDRLRFPLVELSLKSGEKGLLGSLWVLTAESFAQFRENASGKIAFKPRDGKTLTLQMPPEMLVDGLLADPDATTLLGTTTIYNQHGHTIKRLDFDGQGAEVSSLSPLLFHEYILDKADEIATTVRKKYYSAGLRSYEDRVVYSGGSWKEIQEKKSFLKNISGTKEITPHPEVRLQKYPLPKSHKNRWVLTISNSIVGAHGGRVDTMRQESMQHEKFLCALYTETHQ